MDRVRGVKRMAGGKIRLAVSKSVLDNESCILSTGLSLNVGGVGISGLGNASGIV